MRSARAAVIFLTRLPAGRAEAADFARAPGWFAVVGLLVGAIQGLGFWLAAGLWGVPLAVLAALALGLLVTGALHEDGLADTFDGLGSGRPAERALEIMRDSRIGAFGALALLLVLSAQALALAGLAAAGGLVVAVTALMAGQGLSRALITLMLRHGPYLRAQGSGSGMTGPLGAEGCLALMLGTGGALGLAFCGLGAGGMLAGLVGLVLGAGVIWLWAWRRLGGVSGDILGAAQQLGLLGFWLGMLAWL